jgi:hypothetical protein
MQLQQALQLLADLTEHSSESNAMLGQVCQQLQCSPGMSLGLKTKMNHFQTYDSPKCDIGQNNK